MSSDEELARECLQGDEQAWETLVRRYQRRLWNITFHFTGRAEEAEELTQEIFLRVLKSLASFDPGGSFAAWISRVARNHCIDEYRRRRREVAATARDVDPELIPLLPDSSPASDPHGALERKALAAWIGSALGRLPRELREAVILRDLRELSYEEIAELLDVPLGTVKSRINRGRLELARRLKQRRTEDASGAPNEERGAD